MAQRTKKRMTRAAAKAATKLTQVVSSAKRAAQASNTNISTSALKKMVRENLRVLKSLGKAEIVSNGTLVYGAKPVALKVTKAHVKKAKPGIDNECALAYALRDSVLGDYITDAHVGNATVKVWSSLNPDVEVKYLLDAKLMGAVKVYDKKKVWPLEEGIYWLNAYAPSLRRGYVPDKPGSRAKRGKAKRSPSRHISLRSDLRRVHAVAGIATKGAKKRA